MTEQRPITPPPELVEKWSADALARTCRENGTHAQYKFALADQAARWGADQELEACCEWVGAISGKYGPRLRLARRPQPKSLAEEALDQLSSIQIDLTRYGMGISVETIRHALERLQELEGAG